MRASGYARVDDDWYVEPAWLVEALLDAERFEGLCWDPACGGGNIPTVLAKRNMPFLAGDIANRRYPNALHEDFFLANRCVDNIISNPPYGVLVEFVHHALAQPGVRKVAVIARLAFLEGQVRKEFFRTTPLARVWVSSRRTSMPPGGVDMPASWGSIAYAWFVWEHGYRGKPQLGWV